MNLQEIEQLTCAFAAQHRTLSICVQAVQTELAAVRRKHFKKIMAFAALAAARKAELQTAIEKSKALFEKPKTRIFDGVKIGYRKLEGKTIIADEDAAVAKLQKLLGDDAAANYCHIKVTIDKEAVATMPADLLKKIGIQITNDTDAVVIKTLDTEIEKLVAALLDASDPSDPTDSAQSPPAKRDEGAAKEVL